MSDVLEFQNVRVGEQQRMTDFFSWWRTSEKEATDDCAIVAYSQSMGKEGMEGRMECQ
jgi:hypothetical protein